MYNKYVLENTTRKDVDNLVQITPAHRLRGEITVPGDKSISHRSIMLGAIANGTSYIHGFLNGADCLSTIDCFSKMGIEVQVDGQDVTVKGRGMHGLRAPQDILYTGNSGTTTRLLAGLLSAQNFSSVLDGDASIRRRPMQRVRIPLEQMGAQISGDYCPLSITGRPLHGISYTLPVASAQLKSSILLAGLYADGETVVVEPHKSRDHTERMLAYMGVSVRTDNRQVTLAPAGNLAAQEIRVPADISSAAFFLAAGAIVKNSQITLRDVGVNETRSGMIDVLQEMGAKIRLENKRLFGGEEVCDITVSSSTLKGTTIGGDLIPRLIDEIPVIAVAALFAEGTTVIKDAQELKVKESNRIDAVVTELKRTGAAIEATEDGMVIHGGKAIHGAEFSTYNDHRMAMSLAILALAADGKSTIDNPAVVDISFPGFFTVLEQLQK